MDFTSHALDATSGFNQAKLLLGSLVLGGIGALFIASHYYNRLKGIRVEAKITALRVDGTMMPHAPYSSERCYYPVFEYAAPDGKIIEAESNSGSSVLADKEPGSKVPVLVAPHDPARADALGYTDLIIGFILFSACVVLSEIAFSSFKTSIFTLLFFLGFAAYGISGILTRIKPRAEWGKINEWRAQKTAEFMLQRRALPLIGRPEWEARMRWRDGLFRKNMPVYVLIAAAFLGVSFYTGRAMIEMEAYGRHAQGVVTRLESSRNGKGSNYYAIARFMNAGGQEVEFKDRIGSSAPLNQPGDKVAVLYMPQRPENAIIDRGLWNWTVSAALAAFGIFLLTVAIKTRINVSRRYRLQGGAI